MSHVAVTGIDATVHECWDDAVQHVATATATPRGDLWFSGRGDGAFFFGPPHTRRQPIGWITSRFWYQVARSRGDLEDLPLFS